ncbi:MAG: hypothetical protein DSY33_03205 [Archaeoglobus sp.]|nr:MAG: hypothetical protein DSY33_03205 [Archaeoglobus sp.]
MDRKLKFKVVCMVFSAVFFIVAITDLSNSIPDSFVLFTVSLCFFFAIKKGEIYAIAASIISLVFALLSLMSVLSSILLLILSHQKLHSTELIKIFKGQIGVIGFISAPFLAKLKSMRH